MDIVDKLELNLAGIIVDGKTDNLLDIIASELGNNNASYRDDEQLKEFKKEYSLHNKKAKLQI